MTLAFEDFRVGAQLVFGAYEVTADEIIEFARAFDPQPFHLDDAAARETLLGGLAASGWHSCAMTMRMLCDGMLLNSTGAGAPGIEETRWVKPVRPGMVLGVRLSVLGTRVSSSRPELGLVTFASETHDQFGNVVMTQRYTNLFRRRDVSAPTPAPEGESAARKGARPEPPRLTATENRTRFAAHFEDVLIGARLALGSHTFTRDQTTSFARRYDPQPFHLDDAAAAATHFGKLSASGWHTAAVYMRLYVETRERIRDENAAAGLPFAANGPSPGFRDLSWLRPVFVGDTISYETIVVDKRPSSRAGWGVVMSQVTGHSGAGHDQEGVKVFESFGASMQPLRGQN